MRRGLCEAHGVGFTVFTSYSGDEDEELDGRRRVRHVSLQVELAPETSTAGLPLMSFIGPANGLAFFRWKEEKEAVVRWPRAWRPKNDARNVVVL